MNTMLRLALHTLLVHALLPLATLAFEMQEHVQLLGALQTTLFWLFIKSGLLVFLIGIRLVAEANYWLWWALTIYLMHAFVPSFQKWRRRGAMWRHAQVSAYREAYRHTDAHGWRGLRDLPRPPVFRYQEYFRDPGMVTSLEYAKQQLGPQGAAFTIVNIWLVTIRRESQYLVLHDLIVVKVAPDVPTRSPNLGRRECSYMSVGFSRDGGCEAKFHTTLSQAVGYRDRESNIATRKVVCAFPLGNMRVYNLSLGQFIDICLFEAIGKYSWIGNNCWHYAWRVFVACVTPDRRKHAMGLEWSDFYKHPKLTRVFGKNPVRIKENFVDLYDSWRVEQEEAIASIPRESLFHIGQKFPFVGACIICLCLTHVGIWYDISAYLLYEIVTRLELSLR